MPFSEKIKTLLSFVKERIQFYQDAEKKIFVSSSFQTHSIPLLHILRQISRDIPVYFINTGFHFPETILYKNQITELLDLDVRSVESPIPKMGQLDSNGRFLYSSDPDECCYFNKIMPLEPILAENDIWITGVRKDQNANRSKFGYEAPGPKGTTRFHPMLDWNSKMIWEYRKAFKLPGHPLEKKGIFSVGCEPCTQIYQGEDRDGRWAGMNKIECGLHL
jgi:phosphoadenosine phosphosulfate reductase